MRTTIELPDEHLQLLGEICRREGVSRAEVVRRAVADYLEARQQQDQDGAFGIWRDRNAEGLAYERQLRREWS